MVIFHSYVKLPEGKATFPVNEQTLENQPELSDGSEGAKEQWGIHIPNEEWGTKELLLVSQPTKIGV
jgi:hypothetical protein